MKNKQILIIGISSAIVVISLLMATMMMSLPNENFGR